MMTMMMRKTISSSPHASFLRRERKNETNQSKNLKRSAFFSGETKKRLLKKTQEGESHKRSLKKKTRRENRSEKPLIH